MSLEPILLKVFKFVTFVFFTLAALLYAGILLLLPLDLMFQVTRLCSALGLPTLMAASVGVGVLAYVGLAVSKMPQFLELITDIGRQLVAFGHDQIKRCDALIEQASGTGA
jgi:hypothetical protein